MYDLKSPHLNTRGHCFQPLSLQEWATKEQNTSFRKDGQKKAIEQQYKGMMFALTLGFKVIA